MDLKDIKAIVDLMKKNSISEFELEKGQEFKIRLKRSANGHGAEDISMPMYLPPGTPVPTQMATATPSSQAAAPAAASNEIEIKSPMVGTFYRAPSPEAANYVEIGAEVHPDTVVCIIEAMKVMNEIKSEVAGRILKILVENGKPVEPNQTMFIVETD